jgi:hypothetical protein
MICGHIIDEKTGEWIAKAITERIIWSTMIVDIGLIKNESVAREFKKRLDFANRLKGYGDSEITLEQLIDHIGLSTNVVDRSWASFTKKIVKNWESDWTYDHSGNVVFPLTVVPSPV